MRYSRQEILKEFGPDGQSKLLAAKVLVIGTGGLGCPVLQYLAAAGVGTIGIVDGDVVTESNLQRQILFGTSDIRKEKVEIAKNQLLKINNEIKVETYCTFLSKDNALSIIEKYEIVVDGTDNFSTRYLINDACVMLNKPYVSASILRFEGQLSVYNYQNGPTYRCIFPEAPTNVPSCEEAGVIGAIAGTMGTLQANEVIKIILGLPTLAGKLLLVDLLSMNFNTIKFQRQENWDKVSLQNNYDISCEIGIEELNVHQLAEKLKLNTAQVLDIRKAQEYKNKNVGGLHLELENIEIQELNLNSETEIIVCCNNGNKSLDFAKKLKSAGFTNKIYSLKGGLSAYFSVY